MFGRSPSLILGACTAIFNVIVAFHVAGFDPTVDQISIVNVAFGAIIALVSNSASTAIAAGEAAIKRRNGGR
jgi:uncharacterized membrane protein YozB (DUF420 family)